MQKVLHQLTQSSVEGGTWSIYFALGMWHLFSSNSFATSVALVEVCTPHMPFSFTPIWYRKCLSLLSIYGNMTLGVLASEG